MNNLHQLLTRLADAEFEFVVVGGYAAVLHGSAFVTNDLDVCALLSPEHVAKLRQALVDLHPVHRMTKQKLSFLDHPKGGGPVNNLYLETDGGVIDELGNVLGLGDYHRLKEGAIEVTLFGRRCRVISLADLITAKEAMGREKDLLTAKELRAIAAKRKGA